MSCRKQEAYESSSRKHDKLITKIDRKRRPGRKAMRDMEQYRQQLNQSRCWREGESNGTTNSTGS